MIIYTGHGGNLCRLEGRAEAPAGLGGGPTCAKSAMIQTRATPLTPVTRLKSLKRTNSQSLKGTLRKARGIDLRGTNTMHQGARLGVPMVIAEAVSQLIEAKGFVSAA